MRRFAFLLLTAAIAGSFGCSGERNPVGPSQLNQSASAAAVTEGTLATTAPSANGPATPPFNLEAILRPAAGASFEEAFGLVKFRQSNDAAHVVYLDVWVRDLAANSAYQLQRAVDTTLDGVCTGTGWLTLGADNVTPRSIMTDARGFGQAALSRTLPPGTASGAAFDIDFRVIVGNSNPAVVVLQSDCYRYVVR